MVIINTLRFVDCFYKIKIVDKFCKSIIIIVIMIIILTTVTFLQLAKKNVESSLIVGTLKLK